MAHRASAGAHVVRATRPAHRAARRVLVAAPLLALAAFQEPAPAAADVGPPPRIADTSAMDASLVALLAERIAAVGAAPGDAEKRRDLGLAYEANSMWRLAADAYGQAIALAPDANEWRFRRGVARYKLGDLGDALVDLRAAAESFKNTPVVQARLGDALRVMGELEEAEAAWRRAIEAEAKQPQQIRYPQSRVGLAQVLLDLDEPAEARDLTEEALAIDPTYRHAHFIRGRALRDLGELEEAQVALALGNDSFGGFPPDPHQLRLGDSMRGYSRRMMMIENLVESNQFAEAKERLDAMLAERPDDFMVQNLAARVALRRGDRDAARTLLEASLEAAPDEPNTLVELCLLELDEANTILAQLGPLQAQAAQAQTAGSAVPAQVAEQMTILRTRGVPIADRAVQHGGRAAELAPFVGRNRFWLGIAQRTRAGFETDQQAAMQQVQGALQTLVSAGKLGCTEPSYHQQLTQLHFQMGQVRKALDHAVQHLARNPRDPNALQTTIQLQLQNGRQEAIKPYVAR
ncbi:MAG: tetratricopeptide repeat protein, partial [Planctomycetota bacterium]